MTPKTDLTMKMYFWQTFPKIWPRFPFPLKFDAPLPVIRQGSMRNIEQRVPLENTETVPTTTVNPTLPYIRSIRVSPQPKSGLSGTGSILASPSTPGIGSKGTLFGQHFPS